MSKEAVSLQAAKAAASRFRAMFKGAYTRWETCGHVRRGLQGPMELVHVVIPAPAPGYSEHDNRVWDQVDRLIGKIELTNAVRDDGYEGPEPGTVLFVAKDPRQWIHRIVLATHDNWPARVVENTGPKFYWAMLAWRLRHAQTLTIRGGVVCAVDRSGVNERLVPIPCPDERTFFRLARTPYKSPAARFARPSMADWPTGMLPEWYPPGVKVFVPPHQVDQTRPTYRGSRRKRS